MTNLNLFSEIYGCYFTVVNRILEKAQSGMSKSQIENLIQTEGFYDSAFYLVPKIISKEWGFLENFENNYYTNKNLKSVNRPLTSLEMAWIKSILSDKRILLFLSKEEVALLNNELRDIGPLFSHNDFHYTDLALDGDNYESDIFQSNFKSILEACINNKTLKINYENAKGKNFSNLILPYKITYSSKDDKFRLIGLALQPNGDYRHVNLNISRMVKVEILNTDFPIDIDISKEIQNNICSEPITLSISTKRHAIERCMLQFASWEKETVYDEKSDRYICKIYYNKQEETELLIRILSFGPVIKVLGHESFLLQIRERIFKQFELNNENCK